jgi:hypothetical protein
LAALHRAAGKDLPAEPLLAASNVISLDGILTAVKIWSYQICATPLST